MNSKSIGQLGENLAKNYLKSKGYKILGHNYTMRSQSGPKIAEIDIIAQKQGILVFVEVKTIKANPDFLPQDKVDPRKIWKISKAAELYMMQNHIPYNTKHQIDVIAIQLLPDTRPNFLKLFLPPKHNLSHFQNVSN